MNKHFGIDVSTWQKDVDYHKAVTEGHVEFAMLRAGFGKNVAEQKDNMFDKHYEGFTREGIPVGAYQYSYATSPAGAILEAEAMLEWIKGKPMNLPLFLDMEETSTAQLGKDTCTMIAVTWCRRIREAGYECGVYANPYWFENHLDPKAIAEVGYIWCASWGTVQPEYPYMLMWQYGGEVNKLASKAVPGVGNVVDQNYYYGDLPSVAPKYTAYYIQVGPFYEQALAEDALAKAKAAGFTETSISSKETAKPPLKSLDEIATEVIQGKWSNGDERERLLRAAGYDYTAVQARVNELFK